MSELHELSETELKELVRDELEDLGIELDTIDIELEDDSRVLLRGKVPSRRLKELVAEAVGEALGADDVVNQIAVVRGANEEPADDDDEDTDDIKDEDDDTVGTEDLGRSVEDGIPYIPPVKRAYREAHGQSKFRKADGSANSGKPSRRQR